MNVQMFEDGEGDLGCESLPVGWNLMKDDISVRLGDRVGPHHAMIGEIVKGYRPPFVLALADNCLGESSAVHRLPLCVCDVQERIDKVRT